jgi:hypothetical protein
VEAAPSTGKLLLYKLGTGVLVLIVGFLFFVSWRNDFKPDFTSWDTYVVAFTGKSGAEDLPGDLEAVKVSNTAYANRHGHPIVVLWGEVRNATQEPRAALTVKAKMVGRKGQVLGEFMAPAGVTFTPIEVFEMDDAEAVPAAYRERLPKVADLKVGPGESVPFMLVIYDHPENMDGVRFRILPATSDDPLRGLPPPPEPGEEDAEGEDVDVGPPEEVDREAGKGGKKPAGTGGVVVKKKGDFVRLKPKQKPASTEP